MSVYRIDTRVATGGMTAEIDNPASAMAEADTGGTGSTAAMTDVTTTVTTTETEIVTRYLGLKQQCLYMLGDDYFGVTFDHL